MYVGLMAPLKDLHFGDNSYSNQRRTTTRRVEDQDRENTDNSSDSEE